MATQYTAGLTTGQVLTAATMNSIGAEAETWTPVVTQGVNVTYTNIYARYQRIQNIVFVYARLNVTSAGTAGNGVSVSLPFAQKNTTGPSGNMSIYDTSANTPFNGFAFAQTTTTIQSAGDWSGNGVWGTFPSLAIASGDVIWLNLTYEAA
jgi:hypothetical protein